MTDQMKDFVQEYLVDFNGTNAAIRAGYSSHTAQVQASRLLTNKDVSKLLEKMIHDDLRMQQGVLKSRVLREMSSIAFSNNEKTRISDKIRALELLGKYLVMWTDQEDFIF
ncbi:MAG: terminase small subunit [Spirochaetales bacterium]|nr:terminase small subunit [Spirochaetales bacterium]